MIDIIRLWIYKFSVKYSSNYKTYTKRGIQEIISQAHIIKSQSSRHISLEITYNFCRKCIIRSLDWPENTIYLRQISSVLAGTFCLLHSDPRHKIDLCRPAKYIGLFKKEKFWKMSWANPKKVLRRVDMWFLGGWDHLHKRVRPAGWLDWDL